MKVPFGTGAYFLFLLFFNLPLGFKSNLRYFSLICKIKNMIHKAYWDWWIRKKSFCHLEAFIEGSKLASLRLKPLAKNANDSFKDHFMSLSILKGDYFKELLQALIESSA